jgi:hypothetical protein
MRFHVFAVTLPESRKAGIKLGNASFNANRWEFALNEFSVYHCFGHVAAKVHRDLQSMQVR